MPRVRGFRDGNGQSAASATPFLSDVTTESAAKSDKFARGTRPWDAVEPELACRGGA